MFFLNEESENPQESLKNMGTVVITALQEDTQMPIETIHKLMEKISCELVLADPEEPETVSGLLPILKQVHGKCMELSLTAEAKEILHAKKLITAVLNDPSDTEKRMTALGDLVNRLLTSFQELRISNPSEDSFNQNGIDNGPDRTDDNFSVLKELLDKFSSMIAGFCPGEIPDLGSMLNALDDLIDASKKITDSPFYQTAIACKTYVENMTLENISNTKPIEEGVVLLKAMLSHLKNGEAFVFDYSDVLELLEIQLKEEIQESQTIEPVKEEPAMEETTREAILDDDMEILIDFIAEAQENLDTIEVNLIELEQDPTDKDIINEIFRPFHTIKGVSGFLSLGKINTLAHTTENLLDSARSGEFVINQTATDVILESVDTLKILIERVKQGTQTGFKQPDDDIPVEALRDKLQALQVSLTKGEKQPLGQILVQKNKIDQASLDQALQTQKNHPDKKIGEILIQEKKVSPKSVASALMAQNPIRKKADEQVKVSNQKLGDGV